MQHRSDAIIYLEDVTVDYDGFKALDRLNFFMDRRELRVVIGPNGAGQDDAARRDLGQGASPSAAA